MFMHQLTSTTNLFKVSILPYAERHFIDLPKNINETDYIFTVYKSLDMV